MIIITGSAELHPEHRDQAVRLGCEHSQRSRAEPGCLSHNCYIDAEDENRMHFFEQWQDMAAVQTHFAVPESGQFMREIGALSASEPELTIYKAEAVDATR